MNEFNTFFYIMFTFNFTYSRYFCTYMTGLLLNLHYWGYQVTAHVTNSIFFLRKNYQSIMAPTCANATSACFFFFYFFRGVVPAHHGAHGSQCHQLPQVCVCVCVCVCVWVVESGQFSLFLLRKHFITEFFLKKIRRCKWRSKFSLLFFASPES